MIATLRYHLQGNTYSKILTKDDNNNEVKCRATNPHFDAINEVIMDPHNGFSEAKLFNVTCKSVCSQKWKNKNHVSLFYILCLILCNGQIRRHQIYCDKNHYLIF